MGLLRSAAFPLSRRSHPLLVSNFGTFGHFGSRSSSLATKPKMRPQLFSSARSIVLYPFVSILYQLPFLGTVSSLSLKRSSSVVSSHFSTYVPAKKAYVLPGIDDDFACDSIFCYTPLLQKNLEVGLKRDWRKLKLKTTSEYAKQEFNELMAKTLNNPSREDVENFTSAFFVPADDVFVPSHPVDWKLRPKSLLKIEDPILREFAFEVNKIWPELTRKIGDFVHKTPDRYAYIYAPNNHIVPGGNFSSFYYWDSYWIVKGLLFCEMNETVKGILENFLSMVDRFGFVPNGGMVCYERRSQPPFLIPMVNDFVHFTGDMDFLKKNIRTLDTEFEFWFKNRTMSLVIDGVSRQVFHYDGQAGNPRPERMRQDLMAGEIWTNDVDRKRFYRSVKSACESGWDFSSRWIIHNGTNKGSISYTAATYIIPVDLQAFVAKNAEILSDFHFKLGHDEQGRYYAGLRSELCQNISSVFWDEKNEIWFDYDSVNMKKREYFYLSNVTPLWAGCTAPGKSLNETADAVVRYLRKTKALDYPGGVPTSFEVTGEQWDFPNAWAPINHLLWEALERSDSKTAKKTAREVAEKWVRANYYGFKKHGAMFEKYDVTNVGEPGGGGEYIVQKGFGWTNGAVLDMMMRVDLGPAFMATKPSTGQWFAVISVSNFMAVIFLVAFVVGFSAWSTIQVCKKREEKAVGFSNLVSAESGRIDASELERLQMESDDSSSEI